MKTLTKPLTDLPTPTNISIWWNFGSLLGMCLMIQILSGLFLSMFYCPNINLAFESTIEICRNINYGWLIRTIHSNGASLMFIFLYLHISRGLYYGSYKLTLPWLSGMIIMIMSMMTAFLGYVLPWGQMSLWGATVITNLLSSIPYLGEPLLQWIWGGFNINNATLNRFFSLHFITPLLIMMMMLIHLMMIHTKGSNNPLGTNSNMDKIAFHPLFSIKDMMSAMLTMMMFTLVILVYPYILNDPENFFPANPLKTPIHIKPEWYFLFAYAILRSIPNKLGGVLAMITSIMILGIMPLMKKKMMSTKFCPLSKMSLWILLTIMISLTWLSTMPIKEPFIMINQMMTIMYFVMFILLFMSNSLSKLILFK